MSGRVHLRHGRAIALRCCLEQEWNGQRSQQTRKARRDFEVMGMRMSDAVINVKRAPAAIARLTLAPRVVNMPPT